MPKYYVEVFVCGRVTVAVEAENERDAERRAYEHPDVPDLDKYYDTDATTIGEVEDAKV